MANGHKSAAHTDSPDVGASNCKTCLGGGPMLIVFFKKMNSTLFYNLDVGNDVFIVTYGLR